MTPIHSVRAAAQRFTAAGAVLFLSLLSCGREITGPGGGLRFAEGLSFVAEFPGEMASVEQGAAAVVPYSSVRVVFTRANGNVALARVFPVSSDVPEFQASLQVQIAQDAPVEGELLDLTLQYINAAGDTVFRGGPVEVRARSLRRGEPPPQPTPVTLTYTGPGASATSIAITPDTIALEAGAPFTFTATARDAQGAVVANAPILFTALDAAKASITANTAGAGLTSATRGSARVRVALAAGTAADTGIVLIAPKPVELIPVRVPTLVGVAGTVLSDSIVIRLMATDGQPIAGATVTVDIFGGGTVNDSTLVTDAAGQVAVLWTLGPTPGVAAQALTFSSAGVGSSTFNANVTEPVLPATQLFISEQPTSGFGASALGQISIQARNAQNAVATAFTGTVTLDFIEVPVGATITGTTTANAVGGFATFNGLIPDKVGTYRFVASAPGLAPDTSAAVVVGAGSPATISLVSGLAQSGPVNSLLPTPIVVRVDDAAGNAVPNIIVNFAVAGGGGTLTAPVDTTDVDGLAQLGSWTLGATVGTQTITANVVGIPALTISATGLALAPTITLGVIGSNVIGFGRTGTIGIRLGQPAPVGGLDVSLQSDNPAVLSLSTGLVTIPAGDTLGTVDVTGVTVGAAAVRAGAAGWQGDTIAVDVSLNLISLPATLNVPLDGAVSLPVQLSTAAPVGGVGVTLTISNPSVVSASPNPVTITAGSSTQNASVTGLQLGTTTITATHPNYAPASTAVTVTAGVDITTTSLVLNQSFSTQMTVRLVSGVTAVAAPAGGIVLNLSSGNTNCAVVPPTATIAAGFTSTAITVSAGAGTTFPCQTFVYADGPAGFTRDSVNTSVSATPAATGVAMTLGSGLQRNSSVSLGYSQHGGVTVRVTSSDPTRVLVAPDLTSVGAPFVDLNVNNGSFSANIVVQALEGFVNDSASLIVTAPGFTPDTVKVTILQPIYDIVSLISPRNTAEGDSPFQIRLGTPTSPTATSFLQIDETRIGAPPLIFSVINDSLGVADLVTTARVADSVTVQVAAGQSSSPSSVALGGVAIRSTAAGVTTVRAVSPSLRFVPSMATRTVTIEQSAISGLSGITAVTPLGRGLMRTASVTLTNPVAGSPLPITVKPARPGLLLLSTGNSTQGSPDSVVVNAAVGFTSASISIQALETPGPALDTVSLVFSAPGYLGTTAVVTLVDPVLEINTDIDPTPTTSTADDIFTVEVGSPTSPTATVMSSTDQLRVGGPGLVVNLVTDSIAVSDLVTASRVADSVQITMPASSRLSSASVSTGGVAHRLVSGGVTTVRAASALTRELPTALRTVTVTAPSISVLSAVTLASGLMRSGSLSLDSPAPVGGLPVTIKADVPGVLQFAPNTSTLGTDSLVVVVPAGSTNASFLVHALDVQPDTVVITASSPGWNSRSANVFVWQPVIQFNSILTSITTLTADDDFVVIIGVASSPTGTVISNTLPRRFGAPPLPVTVISSNGLVGKLVVSGVVRDTAVVNIAAGSFQTPGTAATGAVSFRPLTTGSTVVSASAPGARTSTGATPTSGTTVNVSTPTITVSSPTVGAGLQTQNSTTVVLQAANHGGVNVIVKSSNPAVLRVARVAGDIATDSIIVPVADGIGSFSYFVAGVEGQTGSVQVSARASGFVDGSGTATVVAPGIAIVNTGSTWTAGTADRPFWVQVGIRNANNTALTSTQAVRTGGPPIAVTITSSNVAAVPLITSTTNAASATVNIVPGATSSPTTVAAGGVALRPLSAGSTSITATSPGLVPITTSTATVTISP